MLSFGDNVVGCKIGRGNRLIGVISPVFVDAGEYHFSNGDVYHGDWVEEMMEGTGKLTSTDGETYEGELSAVSLASSGHEEE